MMLPFSKPQPGAFDSFMCVMKVQCVSIYNVPTQRGGLITCSRCRLTRPLTEYGVKERFDPDSHSQHTVMIQSSLYTEIIIFHF